MQMHRGRLAIEKGRIESSELLYHLISLHRHENPRRESARPTIAGKTGGLSSSSDQHSVRVPNQQTDAQRSLSAPTLCGWGLVSRTAHVSPLRNIPVCDHRTPA